MPVTLLSCPSCKSKLKVPDSLLGQTVRCASCQTAFEARQEHESAPPPASPFMSLELGDEPSPPSQEPRSVLGAVEVDATGAPVPSRPPAQEDRTPSRPPTRDRWGMEREDHDDRNADRASRRRRPAGDEECPICGTPCRPGAARCRHCGEYLDDHDDDWDEDHRDDRTPRRRDCLPHRGGLVLSLGIAGLVLGVLPIFGLPVSILAWVFGQGDLGRMKRDEIDREGHGMTLGGMICGIVGTFLNLAMLVVCTGFFWMIYDTATRPPTVRPRYTAPPAPPPPWRNR